MSFIKNPVQIITRTMTTPDRRLSIDYPVVLGISNTAVQHMINTAIFSLVHSLITQQGFYQDPRMTMQGWYEIKTNERGILSLSIGNYAFPYHAAHGMTVIKSLTFDVETGKQYSLGELFTPGSNYVKVLSDIVAQQIKERELPLLGEFKGIGPNQDYYIADKALVLYFQLYDLTPYYYGFPMFPVSVYEIQDIILEDGPLGKMAIND